MNRDRNIFTYLLSPIKTRVKEVRNIKLFATFFSLAIIVGSLSLSVAIPSLINYLKIGSSGRILAFGYAASGSADDIQAAVDIVATSGGGNVYIPEGNFNFVDVGEPWMTVSVPAGVSIFGAPTEKGTIAVNNETIHNMPLEWKTVLGMSYDVPSVIPGDHIPVWFHFQGDANPNKPSRFSDIKLVGWRESHPESTYQSRGVTCDGIIDMRIDHCYFRDICGGNWMGGAPNQDFRGVMDHCILINTNGIPEPYPSRTVGYGMGVSAGESTIWTPDIYDVQGKYGWQTVFIEDCYFEKWRHSVCGGHGAHYVFRHNIIKDDFGFGSIDAHGTYAYIGTRAIEVYENLFLDPIWSGHGICFHRGGAGVYFNNTVRNEGLGYYYSLAQLACEGQVEYCWPNDIYIWDNDLAEPTRQHPVSVVSGTRSEGVHYFFYPMPNYKPYQYPHPLTLEDAN